MNPVTTLTLHTRCAPCRLRGGPILACLCVTALLLLTGCITSKQTSRVESSLSHEPSRIRISPSKQASQQPGYQRVTDPVKVTDPEQGTVKSVGNGSAYPDWLNISPEGIHYPPPPPPQPDGVWKQTDPDVVLTDHFGHSDEQPALVTVEGFLAKTAPEGPDVFDSVFDDDPQREPLTLWKRVKLDHANYYSKESLTWLAGGFGVGAIMANTSIDVGIQNHFQSSVIGATSDDWIETLHAQKELGNGRYTLPVFAAAWVAGKLFKRVPLAGTAGEWGERSIRAILVGTPPMLAMQYVTGASRPGETSSDSRWKPFQDNNGVSGHSFMGAIPFLAAAKMTDKPLLKLAFYAGSTLAPLSRVNDDRHYPSQAFLGWWMAWIATNAVDATQHPDRNWSIFPMSWPGATGVGMEFRY